LKKWLTCLILLVTLALLTGITLSCSNTTTVTSTATSIATSTTTATTAAKTVVLKLAVAIPPDDPMVQALNPWIETFNKAAKGAFEMQLFAGGALGGTSDMLDAVRTGAIEIGHGSIPTFSGHDPAFSAAQLPYMFDSFDANAEFCRLILPYTDSVMEKKFNQKLLASWNMGFNEFYTAKKQVRTMDDVKGLNIAVTGVTMAQAAQALGGNPVTMDWPDEYPSLQKGVVDAGMATVSFALDFMNYAEVIKYYIGSSFLGGQLSVAINLDTWNKLPPDLQQVMIDEGQKYQETCIGIMRTASMVDAIANLKSKGVDVYNLPADEHAKWKAACQPIVDEYWKKMGADAKTIQDAVNAANSKYPYQ
jgi:TRAP-type C4-dicarboxylate transport system substrate-binding protein